MDFTGQLGVSQAKYGRFVPGIFDDIGTGSPSLAHITCSGTGGIAVVESSGAGTLGAITCSGTGDIGSAGSSSGTLQRITCAGTGDVAVVESSGSGTLGAITCSGSGDIRITGTGSGTLHAITCAGTGDVADIDTSGAGTLHAITCSGSGGISINGIGAADSYFTGILGIQQSKLSLFQLGVPLIFNHFGPTLGAITCSGFGRIFTGPGWLKRVQHASTQGSGTTITVAFPAPLNIGDFLIAGVGTFGTSQNPVLSDNLSNPWVKKVTGTDGATNGHRAHFFRVAADVSNGGMCTVTVSFSPALSSAIPLAIGVVEYSGTGTLCDFNASITEHGISSNPISGFVPIGGFGDFVTGLVIWGTTVLSSAIPRSPYSTVESQLNGGAGEGLYLTDYLFVDSWHLTAAENTFDIMSNPITYVSLYAVWAPDYSTSLGGSGTLARITASGHGPSSGTGTPHLQAITCSGTGAIINRSTSAAGTLKRITCAGSGTHGTGGFGSPTLQRITCSGTGGVAVKSSSASPKLSRVTTAGSGWTGGMRGSGTLPRITASGSGAITKTGSGSGTLKKVLCTAGVGDVAVISTSASPQLQRIVCSAGFGFTGPYGFGHLPRITASGTGIVEKIGTGSGTLKRITCAGYGPSGFGYDSLKPIICAGIGNVHSLHGSGSATLARIVAFGSDYGAGGVGAGRLHAITCAGSGLVPRIYNRPIFDAVTLAESVSGLKCKPRNVSETLTIVEVLEVIHVINNQIQEHLTLTEDITGGRIFSRNISEHLNIIGGVEQPVGIGNLSIHLPELTMILVRKKKSCVSLACSLTNSVIDLPVPELGDTEAPQLKVVAKRSMNNKLMTYTRRNRLRKLNYTFVVGRPMALSLQAFIDENFANVLDMQNWKGELWKVQITNNPVPFTGRSLFANEGEKYEVELELQGIRVI